MNESPVCNQSGWRLQEDQTRSQASGGIQCSARPSHLTLQPIGLVCSLFELMPTNRTPRGANFSAVARVTSSEPVT